jgi:Icc-related predicted phosphoesterase
LLKIQEIAETEIEKARKLLQSAVKNGNHIIFMTHVPPWLEASRAPNGTVSDPVWRPWFCSILMGKMLERVASDNPTKLFTILCGHTHSSYVHQVADNLVCRVAGAEYGEPQIENIITLGVNGLSFSNVERINYYAKT